MKEGLVRIDNPNIDTAAYELIAFIKNYHLDVKVLEDYERQFLSNYLVDKSINIVFNSKDI